MTISSKADFQDRKIECYCWSVASIFYKLKQKYTTYKKYKNNHNILMPSPEKKVIKKMYFWYFFFSKDILSIFWTSTLKKNPEKLMNLHLYECFWNFIGTFSQIFLESVTSQDFAWKLRRLRKKKLIPEILYRTKLLVKTNLYDAFTLIIISAS